MAREAGLEVFEPVGKGLPARLPIGLPADCVLNAEALLGKKMDRFYQSRPSIQLATAPPPKA